jgi:diguanylate cyclase (GGDEF)-like protein/PAS domain S-box-containing protein
VFGHAHMSFLFKPPAVAATRVTFRDLWTLGDESDPFWRRVRAARLGYLDNYLWLNIAVATLNGSVVLMGISHLVSTTLLWIWALVQGTTIVASLYQRHLGKRFGGPAPSDTLSSQLAIAQLFLVGLSWGLVFLQALGAARPEDLMLVVALTIAGMGCLFFSTAIWPLGALAMSGVVAACTLIGLVGLVVSHDGQVLPLKQVVLVAIVLFGFVLFIARGCLTSSRDMLRSMRLQERLEEQEEMLRLLLNEYEANGSDWLFEFDDEGRVTFVSSRFAEATGTVVDQVIGTRWAERMTDPEQLQMLIEITSKGIPYRDQVVSVEINGETRWWSLSGTPKFADGGRLTGYRGVGSDVTERHLASQRIAELATSDALTGLINRRVIHQSLADGLQAGDVALLFVDLDRFKAVNDSLGHAIGDRLLKEVATRLREALAGHAGGRATVGRLGGDEFAVVVRQTSAEEATRLGEVLISRLSLPYSLGDKQATIGASVGLAVGPADGSTVEALMRAADLALYDVKGKGRGKVRHYDRAMHKRVEERRELEYDLKSALEQNQLRLVFQPVVNALDERVAAFEALLRWRHPVLGEISPAVFIPIAEEGGLIGRIGDWVLNEACRVASGWPRHVKIAVNLSPLQFDDPRMVETVRLALARWKLAPQRLELELTESLFLDERAQTSQMLDELQDMGVTFALDDFGTGYSSLGYLQKINFRRIKIDRSFVQASAADGGESTAIIQAIVALAERLGMETTAEGTETRAEFEAMRRLGCGQMQGWYFGRPMDPEDVRRLLDRSRPLIELVEVPGAEAEPWAKITRSGQPMLPGASARSRVGVVHSSPPGLPAPPEPPRD